MNFAEKLYIHLKIHQNPSRTQFFATFWQNEVSCTSFLSVCHPIPINLVSIQQPILRRNYGKNEYKANINGGIINQRCCAYTTCYCDLLTDSLQHRPTVNDAALEVCMIQPIATLLLTGPSNRRSFFAAFGVSISSILFH